MTENSTIQTAESLKKKRIVYLTSSTIALLFLGLIYAFSMFAAPICTAFDLEKASVSITFNIMMIAFCVGAVIGSQIEKRFGLRIAIICSAVLFLCGFAGCGLLGQLGIGAVYVLYGVCGGLGVGIGYNSIIATTNVWFPDKMGFSSGVLLMGFGLGSLMLGTLSVNFLGTLGLPVVFCCIGAATFIVVLFIAFFLKRPPADIVQILAPQSVEVDEEESSDDGSIFKTPTFYVYCIWAIIVIAIGLATIGNCASDAQLAGWDATAATLLVGFVSTFNGLARVVIGLIYDKTNVKITMLIDGAVAVAAAVCVMVSLISQLPVLYAIGAFCCGFCYGGVPVVASAFARQRFGSKKYPFNLSVANFAIVFGSLLNLLVQASVGGAENRITLFGVFLALSAVALLDVLPFSKLWNRDMKRLDSSH